MTVLDNQLRSLRPRRTYGKPTAEGDFVVFEAVPVFDEHIGEDGVHYDADLLKKIADNNNRRIRDTGDYCAVVVGHTVDRNDKKPGESDPPVIGLAGPFFVGSIGHENPRPCILANFWIFPEDEKTFLANPRRSVEVWPEENPEDRYFDPIAVLGSETPRRDLGMVYAKKTSYCVPGPLRYAKRSVCKMCYEEDGDGGSSEAFGSNTFIPSGTNVKKKDMPKRQAMLATAM